MATGAATGTITDELRSDLTTRLVSVYGTDLHGYVARRFPTVDPDDTMQNVYLRMHKNWQTIEWQKPVRPYAYKVTHNAALTGIQREWRTHGSTISYLHNSAPTVDSLMACAQPLDAAQEDKHIRNALAHVPQAMRAVTRDYVLRNESYEALASKHKIPIGTVKSRLHRALPVFTAALRLELENNPQTHFYTK